MSERRVGIREGAPHVRDGAAVVTQPRLRLFELPADQVDERLDADHRIRIERIEVADRDFARCVVPTVLARKVVVRLDVRGRRVVAAKDAPVEIGILVPRFRITRRTEAPGDT